MDTIVWLGDSVTHGVRAANPAYGNWPVTEQQTFRYLVGQSRGLTGIDKGVPGNTSFDGLARLQTDVLALAPQVCCVMFGVNDCQCLNPSSGQMQGIPVSLYQSNLASIVSQCKAAGIRTTLLTPSLVGSSDWIDFFDPYLDAVRTVAGEYAIPCVDVYLNMMEKAFVLGSPTYNASGYINDYQHPGPVGHQLIADLILEPWNAGACA